MLFGVYHITCDLARQPHVCREASWKPGASAIALSPKIHQPPQFVPNYSSSLSSSSSSSSSAAAAFFAGFFFFFLFLLFDPVDFDSGCSRIFKISSSSIFLSDLTASKSRAGGAANRVMPFLVIATSKSAGKYAQCRLRWTYRLS